MSNIAENSRSLLSSEISWKINSQERKWFEKFAKKKLRIGEPQVLWGWKRDKVLAKKRHPESRTIYFSADLSTKDSDLFIKRAYFFLETRAEKKEIRSLKDIVGKSRDLHGFPMRLKVSADNRYKDYSRLRMEIGEATDYDRATVLRRLKGKPRLFIAPPRLITESKNYDLRELSPFVLYCGSGLSSECGLPLLSNIHDLFEVDDESKGKLIFGNEDRLPERMVEDLNREFKNFCQFTVDAVKAKPTASYFIIRELYKKGIIRQVFTDNVDDILSRVDVAYIQTRLSIFPDRFPVKPDDRARALLVIGISVDRRDVIKQARRKGMKIISINPILKVAPYSRNMDYLSKGDILFRGEAREILPKIVKNSGF